MNTGSLLHAYLADTFIYARGLHDWRAFVDLEGEGLFNIHIASGVERIDCGGGVPVVGRGDQDRIHLFHLEEFSMVSKALGVRRIFLGFIDMLAVDIADSRHIDGGIHLELRHIVTAALAAANHAQLNFVVRAKHARVRKRRESAGCAEEFTASNVRRHVEIIRGIYVAARSWR